MILDADLLRLAEKLCLGTTESEWRCAVSRAYYAAFHRGRDLLQALGFEVPRGEQAHARFCGADSKAAAIHRWVLPAPT